MITNEQYHADTSRVSKSGLDLIEKSPAHYYANYLDPNRTRRVETAAMFKGTAVHSVILEPNSFEKTYYKIEDNEKCLEIGGANPRATTKYKEWLAALKMAHHSKIALSIFDYELVKTMRDATYAHPVARRLLEKGVSEQTILWTDPETGVPCKCRPDRESTDTGFIIDIKSTEDASPNGFAKSVANYRYDVQAPLYVDGYTEDRGIAPEGFVFIAIEKTPPYNVGVYYTTKEIFQIGRNKYKKNLKTYAECRASNNWPGYSNDFQPLILPRWAQNQ